MEITYLAELTASFQLSDSQFKTLWDACKGHYDGKVQSLVEVGGFMYGHKHSRDFATKMGFATPEIALKSREINLLAKSLEMDYTNEGLELAAVICTLFFTLQNKNQEINLLLNPA